MLGAPAVRGTRILTEKKSQRASQQDFALAGDWRSLHFIEPPQTEEAHTGLSYELGVSYFSLIETSKVSS